MELVESDSGSNYEPKEFLALTPFPGTTITARMTDFSPGDSTTFWTGEITGGGSGEVMVALTNVGTVEGIRQYVAVMINSDVGAFRVEATEIGDYYVMMELNPYTKQRPM